MAGTVSAPGPWPPEFAAAFRLSHGGFGRVKERLIDGLSGWNK
jgi:hypothetical protein